MLHDFAKPHTTSAMACGMFDSIASWHGGYVCVRSLTWGTHPVDERGCEALSSLGNLNTWILGHSDSTLGLANAEIHKKSIRNHQKSMILKMNQDTYGYVLRYQESLGVTFDTARLHKT